MEVKEVLTKRDIRIIRGAMNSTLEQLKGTIRRNEHIPNPKILYANFAKELPFILRKDKPCKHYVNIIDRTTFSNDIERSGIYQVVFYFNDKVMYVSATYKDTSYRGNKYLSFYYDIYFLDELHPDIAGEDYLLASIMEGCHMEEIGIRYERLD